MPPGHLPRQVEGKVTWRLVGNDRQSRSLGAHPCNALLCDITHTKFNNQIITGIKTNLCNGSVGFNYRPR